MEARLKQELPAIPTKQREESWADFWRRALDERTSQLEKAAEELALVQKALDSDCHLKALDNIRFLKERWTEAVNLEIERDELRTELARERARHQDLRQVVKSIADGNNDICCLEEWCTCPSCKAHKALEPQPAPVAANAGEEK